MHQQNNTPNYIKQEEKEQPSFRRSDRDPQAKFTIIPNEMLCDKSISLAAKGLLAYLLHHREDWVLYQRQLRQATNTGERALNTILQELIEAGYMTRTRSKLPGGKFQPYQYQYSGFKIFLPDDVLQSAPCSLQSAVLTNTNRTKTKETTAPTRPFEIKKQAEKPAAAPALNKCHDNIRYVVPVPKPFAAASSQKKKEEKQEVYNCLINFDIGDSDKKWITKHFTEAQVERSLAWVTHPTTKVKKTIAQALKWFLSLSEKEQPKTPNEKKEDLSENKQYAEKIERAIIKGELVAPPGSVFTALSKHAEICISPYKPPVTIAYNEENFKKLLIDNMSKKGYLRVKTET